MAKVNPKMLKWARDSAGLNLADAAHKINLSNSQKITRDERLRLFETGEIEPTAIQIQKMAHVYHRSSLFFYLEAPPEVEKLGVDFRTIPREGIPHQEQNFLNILEREVFKRQNYIRQALEDLEEDITLEFVGSIKNQPKADDLATKISKFIGFDIGTFRKQTSAREAFKYLRQCIESVGVYVLLMGDLGNSSTNISNKTFRGMAISDPIAPMIVINDNDAKAAYAFTALHELTHIWLGHTGISNDTHIAAKSIEKYCDAVASTILLNKSDLLNFQPRDDLFQSICLRAKELNVSGSMLAYRLYADDKISRDEWADISNKLIYYYLENKRKEKEKNKSKSSGPNFDVIQKYHVGNAVCALVKRTVDSGAISLTRAGAILGIKPTSTIRFLEKI